MKALWTQDEAAFHGSMVNFDPVWSYPKPAQKPHPPILLGGSSDHTLKRVVEFCDGWIPLVMRGGFDPREAVQRLRKAAAAGGRDYATLSITAFGAAADPTALAGYRDAGFHRAVLPIPDVSRDEILKLLDKYAPLAK
jgi:alkanesulfonate monooxygenase SsuD/methylene tetrahydromethanopterin reductase-like flavin-dependent oxidoreductase (luciferase family)